MTPTSTLVVDDNADFLDAATRFLAIDGRLRIVGMARSGREAIDKVSSMRPDLVLMDWSMPEMNGLEATRYLKGLPDAPCIVIVTQHDSPAHRAAASAAGADGFVTKAEFGAQLLLLLEQILHASDETKPLAATSR